MLRIVYAVLFAIASGSAVRADDEWLGQWVFPRHPDLPVLDWDDEELMRWTATSGKLTWVGKEWIMVRHSQGSGPYEGYVKKSEVVKLGDATQYFTDLIGKNEKNAGHFHCRGLAWHEKKEYEKAIRDYNEAIRLDPKSALAFLDRGLSWHQTKEYDKAIRDYNEAIRLDPSYGLAFNNRGGAWRDKKEFDKAIRDYTEAIRLDPDDPLWFDNSARLLATCPDDKCRDGKRAIEMGTKACELSNWKDMTYIDTLAAASAEGGDFDQAVKYQKQVIDGMTKEEEQAFGKQYRDRLKLYEQKKPYREP